MHAAAVSLRSSISSSDTQLPPQDAARLLPEGCPALAAEFEASGTRELLVRDAWLRARARVFPQTAADSASPPPPAFSSTLVLDGPSGAGKSVLLALLVAAARDAGWVALYVPQGRALTGGSLFFQHEGVTPPMWDTPGHAAQLLTALWAAHGSVLQGLPQRRPGVLGGLTLGQLHAAGTSQSATPVAAVDALLAMVQELRLVSEVPTMVAIDELNALWGWTEYHQTTGPRSRKRLHAGQLRVAATLRAFDSTPGPARGVLLGATSATAGISPKVHVANLPKGARAAVPRFSLQETGAMVAMYAAAGRITSLAVGGENEPDEQAAGVQQAARKLHALTVGSGADLRDILPLV